ncbi:hypothetical protein G2W53_040248 [Senna tora]|uniref:Uncharacterized protein n=1 Tax=Senna tora TaxID=362788 RepID=A0A834W3E6_9FABA|nr:hypothetical protein G2W53_040248 [Senna tora]
MEKHQAHRHVLMNCTQVDLFLQDMGRSKRLRISQSESKSTELPPETTQHFTSSAPSTPTSAPTSAPIPDEVSKQCNRYWTIDIIDEEGVVRQGRLKVLEVWSLPLGQRVVVPFNAQAQPVGEAVGLLSGFIGLVVTDVATFPISYHSWDKAMSEKNRENRSKLKMPHTCGSKSMARKKHEKELASGKPVSRGAVFVATRKRKDGSYVNDNAKIVSVHKLLDGLVSRTLGYSVF